MASLNQSNQMGALGARAINRSRTVRSKRGDKAPSFEVVERLARALKVDYHELFLPDRLATGHMEDALKLAM